MEKAKINSSKQYEWIDTKHGVTAKEKTNYCKKKMKMMKLQCKQHFKGVILKTDVPIISPLIFPAPK